MYLGEILTNSATNYPHKECIIFGDKRLTYSEVNGKANRLANALQRKAIGKGERIAIYLDNCPQLIQSMFASFKAGYVVVPINYRLKGPEIQYLLENSGSQVLIFGQQFKATVDQILPNCPAIRSSICVYENQKTDDHFEAYSELTEESHEAEPRVDLNENDLAVIFYTSGTTGKPKGVMLSHKNILFGLLSTLVEWRLVPADITYVVTPIIHISAFWLTSVTLFIGGTLVVDRRFDREIMMERIQKERVTFTHIVPSILNLVLSSPNLHTYDLTSLKRISYGAQPMPVSTIERAMEVFQGCSFFNCYGQTEHGAQTNLRPEDHLSAIKEKPELLGSVGKPSVGYSVRIVDDRGMDVEVGEVGELISKSDAAMIGYWSNPEETEKALKDGWVYSGDYARFDKDGYIYMVDRKKDLIIRGGLNVYPVEVENVLLSNPKVKEVAVFGVPDEIWGEVVKAVVVLKDGESATEEETIEFCRDRLASYKKPTSIDFVSNLPKTFEGGKVMKTVLREKYRKEVRR